MFEIPWLAERLKGRAAPAVRLGARGAPYAAVFPEYASLRPGYGDAERPTYALASVLLGVSVSRGPPSGP